MSTRGPRALPGQLELPLAAAPEPVRAHGLRTAHPRPLVSIGKQPGRPFSSFRTSPARAWRYPEVQYADAGSSYGALALDCDNPDRLMEGLSHLPPANWRVYRPANGHAHAVWTLAEPVHKYPAARQAPLDYFARIADFYAVETGADRGYNGVLAHNPVPPIYKGDSDFATAWGPELPYTLDDLASVLPFGWEPPKVRQTGVGRNVDLFRAGMRWAGRKCNEHLDVLPALMAVNQEFPHPLPLAELQATARQIERYRARWIARGWHCPRWIARQEARGRKGGQASGRARRPGSNEAQRPWEAEGVSRATWYRRRRRLRLEANTDKQCVPRTTMETGQWLTDSNARFADRL